MDMEETDWTVPIISSVEKESIAFVTGLKPGDIIIEINGTHVATDSYAKMRERILEHPSEVQLLVLDKTAFKYYQSENITVSGEMDGISYRRTPKYNIPTAAALADKFTSGNGLSDMTQKNLQELLDGLAQLAATMNKIVEFIDNTGKVIPLLFNNESRTFNDPIGILPLLSTAKCRKDCGREL